VDIYEIVDQVAALVRQRGQATYRSLKRQFALADDYFEDLKAELLYSHPEIIDDEGRGLRYSRPAPETQTDPQATSNPPATATPRPPVSYTPGHLAEQIRAVTVVNGERKTITAVFADLKGSTALIEGLDPEEARAILDPALQLMMDAVHQYEGFVAQALGDGIFALFGAPLAHEDHPQRALYAALRMQDAMRRYADTLRAKGYPPLLMRVGINTGEVVLRAIRKDDLHADYVPVGHSTNLAARMEQLATPGSIVVSAHTHRLTDGYFAFKDLGPTQIKGVANSLNIYELQGVGSLRTRLQVSARRGLTRFVGRQREMEQLQQALAYAKAGHGQIVGTMGEPGLGKSRLFSEFKLLSTNECLVLETYAVSHGKASAYLPVIELLKSYFHIELHDDERTRRQKVIGRVLELDRTLEDLLPYLFTLLAIEEQPSPLQQMDPQIRRRRTFEALKKLFLRESLSQPLILIFEDLHWIDGETQGFLDVLSESLASTKLLLLTNYRPEYRHEWGQKTYYTQLRLSPLGKAESEEFLDVLLGEFPRPVGERARVRGMEKNFQDLKRLILDKTQGSPFFMEEVVQTLVEDSTLTGAPGQYQLTRPVVTLQLPATVQAVLAARIDRLTPEEKVLLQQLSVIGRQFPRSLVRQVITQSEAELYRIKGELLLMQAEQLRDGR
jgi:class 3 adenylate cyclase